MKHRFLRPWMRPQPGRTLPDFAALLKALRELMSLASPPYRDQGVSVAPGGIRDPDSLRIPPVPRIFVGAPYPASHQHDAANKRFESRDARQGMTVQPNLVIRHRGWEAERRAPCCRDRGKR